MGGFELVQFNEFYILAQAVTPKTVEWLTVLKGC